jgi:hypothetical protein
MKNSLGIAVVIAVAQLACSRDPAASLTPVIRELRLVGEVETSGNQFQGVVTILNQSDFRVELGIAQFGCAVPLKLYSATGTLVWNQSQVTGSQAGGCKWIPADIEIPRGTSMKVSSETIAKGDLLAVLPPGVYRAELQVIFARVVPGEMIVHIDSVVTVPAGTLALSAN